MINKITFSLSIFSLMLMAFYSPCQNNNIQKLLDKAKKGSIISPNEIYKCTLLYSVKKYKKFEVIKSGKVCDSYYIFLGGYKNDSIFGCVYIFKKNKLQYHYTHPMQVYGRHKYDIKFELGSLGIGEDSFCRLWVYLTSWYPVKIDATEGKFAPYKELLGYKQLKVKVDMSD